MSGGETATYIAFITLSTEDGELPETLDEVADLIAAQMGYGACLTDPPPEGTGLQCLAVAVSGHDNGEGIATDVDNDGQVIIYTGTYNTEDQPS